MTFIVKYFLSMNQVLVIIMRLGTIKNATQSREQQKY